MMIAMAIVLMMKVSIDEVIDVVAVRNRRMSTSRPVDMVLAMGRAIMSARAGGWIVSRHLQRVFFNSPRFSLMVKMTVVQIVHVIAMLNRCMAAFGSVNVIVMFVILRHVSTPRFSYSSRLVIKRVY
jgi:hypothetical protein